MATNIGNPAFRMALRGLLVRELLGAVPPDPPDGYATRGRHIFLPQNAPKNIQFLKQSFALLTRPLVRLLFRPWRPGGSLTCKKSEKLHMRLVKGRELKSLNDCVLRL